PTGGHRGAINGIALSPDGKMLATAASDKQVLLWQVPTGKELQALRGHQGWVHAVAFMPGGRALASASQDGTVRLWDAATGKEVRTLLRQRLPVKQLAVS